MSEANNQLVRHHFDLGRGIPRHISNVHNSPVFGDAEDDVPARNPVRGARLLHKSRAVIGPFIYGCVKVLQKRMFCEWAMLGSNQRPLPGEGRAL